MRRIWLVLVLLAAIVSMHGIPALPGDDGMSTGTANAHVAMNAPADGVDRGAPAPTPVVDQSMDGPGTSDRGDPARHGMALHLWSLCLAVLLAGAVWVALILIGRTSPVEQILSGSRRVRPPSGLAAVLRPPDLAALCLLRI